MSRIPESCPVVNHRFILPILMMLVLNGIFINGCAEGPGSESASGGSAVDSNASANARKAEKLNVEPESQTPKPTEISPESAPPASSSDAVALTPVNLAGYREAVSTQKGNVVLVEFWATWCVECREMLPHTLALGEKLKGDGLAVLTVSMDEAGDHAAALDVLQKENARVPNLRTVHENFDPVMDDVFDLCDQTLPHVKIYGRDGTELAKFSGEDVTHENIEGALAKAFGNQKAEQAVSQVSE